MKRHDLHVRIARLVLEAPLEHGVTPVSLSDAVRSELASLLDAGAAPHPTRPTPLAGSIAQGIETRLGTGTPSATRGSRHGRR